MSTAADRAAADVRGVLGGIFVMEAGFPFRRGGAGGTFRGFGVGGEGRKSNWYEGQLGGLILSQPIGKAVYSIID